VLYDFGGGGDGGKGDGSMMVLESLVGVELTRQVVVVQRVDLLDTL
jgi:hypothetical protein